MYKNDNFAIMNKKVPEASENVLIKNKIEHDKNIKVSIFKKDIRKTNPHKHNSYFEIIYLSKGKGFHFIDNIKHIVEPPVMYFVRKEQVHHWELTEEPEGFVIIIKKSFIEKTLDNELISLFTKISGLSSLIISENKTIEQLLELLTSENKFLSEHSFTITEGLLKALISKALEVAKPTLINTESLPDLYHSFINLLNSSGIFHLKVAHYAELLNTSPQNLNAVCRKAIKLSASEVLRGFVLNEAKRLLIYTSKTVTEISLALNFSDASHFVKYFKKTTGLTPQKFRINS